MTSPFQSSSNSAIVKQAAKLGLDLDKPVGKKPAVTDAVCGRGSESNLHEGTKRFRALVDSRALDFAVAKSNANKKGIVLERLATFQAKGGRLVRKLKSNGMYYEVTRKTQYRKTIQRLRDQRKHVLDELDMDQILTEADDFLKDFLQEGAQYPYIEATS